MDGDIIDVRNQLEGLRDSFLQMQTMVEELFDDDFMVNYSMANRLEYDRFSRDELKSYCVECYVGHEHYRYHVMEMWERFAGIEDVEEVLRVV